MCAVDREADVAYRGALDVESMGFASETRRPSSAAKTRVQSVLAKIESGSPDRVLRLVEFSDDVPAAIGGHQVVRLGEVRGSGLPDPEPLVDHLDRDELQELLDAPDPVEKLDILTAGIRKDWFRGAPLNRRREETTVVTIGPVKKNCADGRR